MASVSESYGVSKVVGAVLGLELEVEGRNLPRVIDSDLWTVKQDGSLRDGLEYVFARPLGSSRAKEALEVMASAFASSNTRPDYTFRTSTHCHVNVANLELDEVKAMVALYYLFEEYYMNFCAPGRRHNRFCLTLRDATGMSNILTTFMTTNRLPTVERGKYSALNLVTLGTFGTLEFRALEGTSDWDRIFTWVRAIMALRKAGREFGSVKAVLKASPEELIQQMFPTERLKELFVTPDFEAVHKRNRKLLWESIGHFAKG